MVAVPAEVADLVMLQAGLLHACHQPVELGTLVLIPGHMYTAFLHLVGQRGLLFHREAVCAQVRHAMVQGDGELFVPFGQRHPR